LDIRCPYAGLLKLAPTGFHLLFSWTGDIHTTCLLIKHDATALSIDRSRAITTPHNCPIHRTIYRLIICTTIAVPGSSPSPVPIAGSSSIAVIIPVPLVIATVVIPVVIVAVIIPVPLVIATVVIPITVVISVAIVIPVPLARESLAVNGNRNRNAIIIILYLDGAVLVKQTLTVQTPIGPPGCDKTLGQE
jgi:hypothetical protein